MAPDIKQCLECPVSKDELFDAVMTLKTGKCPGADGLSVLFYRKFWKDIVDPLYEMYMHSLLGGKLCASGRRGLINLIPKKSKNEQELRNWRPIVLLNYDFKIWSKMVANRLELATDIISKQQTGFIKNRSIFSNIKRTMEIVLHHKRTGRPGLIMSIDYEKCFDRVEFNSIKKAFRFFGFGEDFIQIMFLLFSNLELCTTSNGFVSRVFPKGRGTNQGCCASPLIFCFCGEIMAHLIRENDKIRGLDVHGVRSILSQFADDTAAFLNFDKISVSEFSDTMSLVERQMGLKVSYEKTTIYHIGSLCDSNAELYTQKEYKWSNDPIDMLGMSIPCDGTTDPTNFNKVICKMAAEQQKLVK